MEMTRSQAIEIVKQLAEATKIMIAQAVHAPENDQGEIEIWQDAYNDAEEISNLMDDIKNGE